MLGCNLKGNRALLGHVWRFGYFGTKKFLDPDLVYEISVICMIASAKVLQKVDGKYWESTAETYVLHHNEA